MFSELFGEFIQVLDNELYVVVSSRATKLGNFVGTRNEAIREANEGEDAGGKPNGRDWVHFAGSRLDLDYRDLLLIFVFFEYGK